MLNQTWRDILFSLRTLRKNPTFTAAALLALGIGIGANTAVFSVVEAVLSFPIPVDDPSKITLIYSRNPSLDATQNPVSMADFLDWREQGQSFEHLAAVRPAAYNLSGEGEPLRIQALQISAGFFPAMGREPEQGRAFSEEDNRPGAARSAVLSHRFWQEHLGGRGDVLGSGISLDGHRYTVVGIAPPNFFFPDPGISLYTPLTLDPNRSRRDQRDLFAVGRLKPGVSLRQASTELETLASRIQQAHPESHQGWTIQVVNMRDNFISSAALALMMLYGAISFVLLIACANVANLLLARAANRQKEFALRSTLGAGRFRLFRQLLTESLILSLSGGVLGLVLGFWGMRWLRSYLATDASIGYLADQMGMSGAILAHTVGISLLAGILFGLAPALRTSKPDVNEALKDGGRSTASGTGRRSILSGLVIAEVALSLALLGVSGTFIRAFNHLYSADPGFNPEQLLTLQVDLPQFEYGQPAQASAFYRRALDRLEQIPGVTAASATTTLPLTLMSGTLNARVQAEGRSRSEESNTPNALRLTVTPRYFETLDIEILEGRALSRQDNRDSFPAAVISQSTARRFWPDSNPIGKRFRLAGQNAGGSFEANPQEDGGASSAKGRAESNSSTPEAAPPGLGPAQANGGWWTVVGVCEDVQNYRHSIRYAEFSVAQIFLPLEQRPVHSTALVMRTQVDPLSIAQPARHAIRELDAGLPLEDVLTMQQVIARIDTQNTFIVGLLSGLAGIALLLAAIGIYGVISYSIGRRSHEIGVRMALGASRRDILLLVARKGFLLAALGIPFGLAASYALVRLLSAQLEGLSAGGA
ncbi:MAG TPA: ABC transporter permease, partial [Acidobacteriota bacterium]|nr:ABC transporter permease [Acidobacteriota bacterium]